MKPLLAAAALAALAVTGAPSPTLAATTAKAASPQAAVEELLAADRALSAASAKLDLADGISAMFADSIMTATPARTFAKGKADATAMLRANPANAGARATWAPVRGGISADGQHGFTFGTMAIAAPGKPDCFAKYLSYWVKQPEGWRVVAYRRIPRSIGDPIAPMAPSLPARLVAPVTNAATIQRHLTSLMDAERAFAAEAQVIGLGPAFAKFGRDDAMNVGQGPGFDIGAATIAKNNFPPDATSPVNWGPDEGALVASSGDLGVTYGYVRSKAAPPPGEPGAFPFFTVWKRDSVDRPWRYIAE